MKSGMAIPAKRVQAVGLPLVRKSNVKQCPRFINTLTHAVDLAVQSPEKVEREAVVVLCPDTKNKSTMESTVSVKPAVPSSSSPLMR
jgi:hypothetical protein